MDKFTYIANADPAVIDDMYQAWKQDPSNASADWARFFEGFEFSESFGEGKPVIGTDGPMLGGGLNEKEIAVRNLIYAWRSRGHLVSKTNPVRKRRDHKPMLDLADFGLSNDDLNTTFQVGREIGLGAATLKTILEKLKATYESSVGFEYMYIRNPEMLSWLQQRIEGQFPNYNPSLEKKTRVLSKLNEAVVFENFLHTKYVGQKRFSLEGGETTIPALDSIITTSAEHGAHEVVIGMAHRGRLNVLANIMGKTYENIFNEFEGNAIPDMTMGDGDVKYHMGYSSMVTTPGGQTINLKLAPNPSHLEAVNPVVEGFARAKIDSLYGGDSGKIVPILIHGDAAVAGQGIVYEVTQMATLDGYNTGGTIHFVINNQVGFTTDFDDARSAIYCTDVAKIIDAPVFHVNGDDPEAVVFCAQLAAEFRAKFKRDIFIDMVCYRRHGHNESDEPKFTQPSLYNIIARHANPREVYNEILIKRGDVDAALADKMDKEFRGLLQERLNMVKQSPLPYKYQPLEEEWRELRKRKSEDFNQSPATGISAEVLEKVGKALCEVPADFKPLKQIEKLLKDRKDMFFEQKKLNWASAELLAYGSLLHEGRVVRLSGQDVCRGTFSHRHAVLTDSVDNHKYCNLNNIAEGQQKLQIFNSLLSEYAVMGFEFGYAMANPNALTIWEAQFGDFANGAQVMIDQFISAGESKWQRMNGLVLLLPHGYEGQGPEHSNARPERFLQLAAEHNMVVANMTSPSNFFHFLRRQLAWPFRIPAVVMSPKSMLRHPEAVSPVEEFTSGTYREVIGDDTVNPKKVKRVLLVSGKLYYEMNEKRLAEKREDLAIVRLEQLHPFPYQQLQAELDKYPAKAQLVFVQEEPQNMGYARFVLHKMGDRSLNLNAHDTDVNEEQMNLGGRAVYYIARKPSASPATGFSKVHAREQAEILDKAFTL